MEEKETVVATAEPFSLECQLWVGGIPQAYATNKRLSSVLVATCRELASLSPSIQFIQKKGSKQGSEVLAYSFIGFPTPEAALLALPLLDKLQVGPGFVLSARPRLQNKNNRIVKTQLTLVEAPPSELAAGQEPDLHKQLEPLSGTTQWERIFTEHGVTFVAEETPEQGLQRLLQHFSVHPRPRRHVKGRPVPPALTTDLLAALQEFKWPENNERSKVMSDKYIVLNRSKRMASVEDCPRSALFDRCHSLLQRMLEATPDQEFATLYTHIAVTKNFNGSPHIDRLDSTHQFALSLGDFTHGELCVDSEANVVYVVTTRNRIAKFDGRYVHWVRGRGKQQQQGEGGGGGDYNNKSRQGGGGALTSGRRGDGGGGDQQENTGEQRTGGQQEEGGKGNGQGDRYSVVYFSNNPRHATTRARCVFEEWLDNNDDVNDKMMSN